MNIYDKGIEQEKVILIVDDVRVTRIAIQKAVKQFGNPITYHAENGHEAISMLQDVAYKCDCIISDFNMPIMHGLQMMKLIRTGYNGIRRDIPVILVTGHGDRTLLGAAMALDVNAFVLKPAKKEDLLSRLAHISKMVDKNEKWIKPVESYSCIDVESSVKKLLNRPVEEINSFKSNAPNQKNEFLLSDENSSKTKEEKDLNADRMAKAISDAQSRRRVSMKMAEMRESSAPKPKNNRPDIIPKDDSPKAKEVPFKLYQIPAGAVLARDIIGSNGQKLLAKDVPLSSNLISRIKDLAYLGEPIYEVWIKSQ